MYPIGLGMKVGQLMKEDWETLASCLEQSCDSQTAQAPTHVFGSDPRRNKKDGGCSVPPEEGSKI